MLKLAEQEQAERRRRGRRPARGGGQGVRRHLLGDEEVAGPGERLDPSPTAPTRRRRARSRRRPRCRRSFDVARVTPRLGLARAAARPVAGAGRRGVDAPRARAGRLAARRPDDPSLAAARHDRGGPRARRRRAGDQAGRRPARATCIRYGRTAPSSPASPDEAWLLGRRPRPSRSTPALRAGRRSTDSSAGPGSATARAIGPAGSTRPRTGRASGPEARPQRGRPPAPARVISTPAARQSSANGPGPRARATSDRGSRPTGSRPSSWSAPSRSTLGLARPADVVVARVQRHLERGGVAIRLLAAGADEREQLGDPCRPDEDEVELVGEADGDPQVTCGPLPPTMIGIRGDWRPFGWLIAPRHAGVLAAVRRPARLEHPGMTSRWSRRAAAARRSSGSRSRRPATRPPSSRPRCRARSGRREMTSIVDDILAVRAGFRNPVQTTMWPSRTRSVTIASAVSTQNDSRVISSVGSGTVWKWSNAQIDSKPSASASVPARPSAPRPAAGSQPSYSPFQPCGAISPTFIRSASLRFGRDPSRPSGGSGPRRATGTEPIIGA